MKEMLKAYRTLKLDLENVDFKINKRTVCDNSKGSSKDYPYTMQNHRIEGVSDEDSGLLIEKSDINAQIKEIERFVDSIEDDEIRMIVQMRYINGKRKPSWQSIACKLGYCSEHTPKRKVQKYFYDGGNGGFSML